MHLGGFKVGACRARPNRPASATCIPPMYRGGNTGMCSPLGCTWRAAATAAGRVRWSEQLNAKQGFADSVWASPGHSASGRNGSSSPAAGQAQWAHAARNAAIEGLQRIEKLRRGLSVHAPASTHNRRERDIHTCIMCSSPCSRTLLFSRPPSALVKTLNDSIPLSHSLSVILLPSP